MSKEDLKSFKISDQVPKPAGSAARAGKAAPPEPNGPSVGFPMIEGVVEADQPDLSGLQERLDQLTAMAKSGSNKDKLQAKKAAAAYNKAVALLHYLLETKARLAGGG
jgi:hypothetical protein